MSSSEEYAEAASPTPPDESALRYPLSTYSTCSEFNLTSLTTMAHDKRQMILSQYIGKHTTNACEFADILSVFSNPMQSSAKYNHLISELTRKMALRVITSHQSAEHTNP